MKSTSSRFRDYKAARNRAPLHVREGGKWVARFVRDPDAQSPAGGVSSTARDLTQWMRLQLGGGKIDGKQLIPTAALAETHRPQVISGFDAKAGRVALYGLGWNVGYDDRGKVRLSHSGGFSLGARTEVALVPAEGIGIAVLSNAAPSGLPEAMTRSFFDLLLHGKVQRDWVDLMNRVFDEEMKKSAVPLADYSRPPAKPSPALPPAAYIATYRNAYFGDLEIAEKGGGLILRLGPDRAAFALRHWDRDLFIYQPRGESATGPGGVSFRIGADGKASAVTVEYLNGNGLGTFARVPVRE
jgi:CubicO group peptidase (beta-lactamase class C family)